MRLGANCLDAGGQYDEVDQRGRGRIVGYDLQGVFLGTILLMKEAFWKSVVSRKINRQHWVLRSMT